MLLETEPAVPLHRVRERGPVRHRLQLHFIWHGWGWFRRSSARQVALRRALLLALRPEGGHPLELLIDVRRRGGAAEHRSRRVFGF